ncbi:DNA/RNA nuclease SfsA [Xanthobacter sp. V3C-3]|uniref:DNA/RNA nuclease SfsA n=1 Tax=Xanthobacter lutulentifluminis TaxID=3119935 RepID=UPI003726A25A
MLFATPLIEGRLVRRYKRFLADVVLEDGTETTAHVANSGAMLGLDAPGSRVWLSRSANPARKLPLSWELVEADFGAGPELVGVNTMHPNLLVAEAIASGRVPELAGYARLRREVRYGRASRIDIQLEDDARPLCLVEVKNVHLMRTPGRAEFPDCVTARGAKHLDELAEEAGRGNRAVMVYVSQIGSAEAIALARDLDGAYGRAFDRARGLGVEALGLACRVTPEGIAVERAVPMVG